MIILQRRASAPRLSSPSRGIRRLLIALLGSIAVIATTGAQAQGGSFPNKQVRIIVTSAAGGTLDIVARILGQTLGERWKQPVIVENRPGGEGTIGLQAIARSAPDGYTLACTATGHLLVGQLTKKLAYEFMPIALPAHSGLILVAHPSSGETLSQVVDNAKKKPGVFNYGSSGEGTATHLASELFASMAGLKLTHVPYKGTGALMPDLLSGNLHVVLTSIAPVTPYVQSGKLRGLGIPGTTRLPSLPQVPTFAEAGYQGFDPSVWYAIVGPDGIPAQTMSFLNSEISWAVRQPSVVDKFTKGGIDASTRSPQEVADFMKADAANWRTALLSAGLLK